MADLEIREVGGASILHGRLAYGQTATISDRGRVRKERLGPDSLGWQMREFAKLQEQMQTMLSDTFAEARRQLEEQLERRNVHVLSGHSFDKPLGDLKGRTARVTSNNDYLDFEVDLPDVADMPTYMQDVVKEVRTGRAGGISPGFRVPPKSAVPNAETFIAEVGNPVSRFGLSMRPSCRKYPSSRGRSIRPESKLGRKTLTTSTSKLFWRCAVTL